MDWGCRELQGAWKLWNLEMVCGQVIFESFENIFCFATRQGCCCYNFEMQNQEGADYFLLSQTNDPSLEYEYLKAYAN